MQRDLRRTPGAAFLGFAGHQRWCAGSFCWCVSCACASCRKLGVNDRFSGRSRIHISRHAFVPAVPIMAGTKRQSTPTGSARALKKARDASDIAGVQPSLRTDSAQSAEPASRSGQLHEVSKHTVLNPPLSAVILRRANRRLLVQRTNNTPQTARSS